MRTKTHLRFILKNLQEIAAYLTNTKFFDGVSTVTFKMYQHDDCIS